MYHVDEKDFKISKRCYAVLPESLHCESVSSTVYRQVFKCTIDACWYRSKSGVISACIGELWDHQYEEPKDYLEFLKRHEDGRHGGDCRSRLSEFEEFWSTSQDLDIHLSDSNFLFWMIRQENYPSIPQGWNGWWRF